MPALRAVCILSSILVGVQNCSGEVKQSQYYRQEDTRLTLFFDQIRDVTDITCCTQCHLNSLCNSVSYNPGSKICQLSSVNITDVGSNSEDSDEWTTLIKTVCFAPPTTAFASVQPSIKYAHEEQRVTYSCNPGSASTTGVTNMTATCQANGTWTALLFECKGVYACIASEESFIQIGSERLAICLETVNNSEAKEACSRFGNLVRIDTTEKQTDIMNYLKDNEDVYMEWDFWIQGHYELSNGTWKWKFDDGSEMQNFFWTPNHYGENQWCIRIKKLTLHSWDDYYCEQHMSINQKFGFICELVPQNE